MHPSWLEDASLIHFRDWYTLPSKLCSGKGLCAAFELFQALLAQWKSSWNKSSVSCVWAWAILKSSSPSMIPGQIIGRGIYEDNFFRFLFEFSPEGFLPVLKAAAEGKDESLEEGDVFIAFSFMVC